MGVRQKGNPPRKRGPKPGAPANWAQTGGKAPKQPTPGGYRPQPPNKKGRGGR